MKAAFYTLGCKVNQYDTQMMKEKMVSAGYNVTDFEQAADIYVVNTCTVTQISDRKSRNVISRARRRNPDAIIVVCGCYAQVSPDAVAAADGVDIVLGTSNRVNIVDYIEQFLKTGQRTVDVGRTDGIDRERITGFSDKTRAILKIEDGCRNFCSYCMIPFARGNIVSKPLSLITAETESVAQNGYREIVLTGIHLSSYGKDLGNVSLADAIRAAAAVPGVARIRLGSLEPTVVTEAFAASLATVEQLCPAFHLSLQSGCDRTLAAMNRRYTAQQYRTAVQLLRKYFDNCAITTDMIVGFPGETDADFEESRAFAADIGFAKIHIFPYSKRAGTKAAAMPEQVPDNIKSAREKLLCAAAAASRQAFMQAQVGRTLSVLVERCENGVCEGFSKNYLRVHFKGDAALCGCIADVTVKEAETDYLQGEK